MAMPYCATIPLDAEILSAALAAYDRECGMNSVIEFARFNASLRLDEAVVPSPPG
jgi:hypothetical protein